MTLPEENMNHCIECISIVENSPQLEAELHELYRILVKMNDYLEDLCDLYEDFPGWEFVHAHVARAFPQPEALLEVIPPR